jgi:hypothetical protein
VTVARHPPQVMASHVNFARVTVLPSTVADAVGADAGCSAHPAAATNIRHNSCFRIVFHLIENELIRLNHHLVIHRMPETPAESVRQ